MNTNIFTNIKTQLKEIISNITVDAGYNYDWGPVNQKNYSLLVSPAFPRCELYFTEDNKDENANANAYSNYLNCEIRIGNKLTFSSLSPEYDIEDILFSALDDLKSAFGKNPSLNDTCDFIQYKSASKEMSSISDQWIPGKLITKWEIRYCQDRVDTSQYASS